MTTISMPEEVDQERMTRQPSRWVVKRNVPGWDYLVTDAGPYRHSWSFSKPHAVIFLTYEAACARARDLMSEGTTNVYSVEGV